MNKSCIICAAIWFNIDEKYIYQPKNIETGFVICGKRHHDCLVILRLICNDKPMIYRNNLLLNSKQGFLTSDDRFVDRKEAGQIAFDANQITKLTNYLFSEDLY